IRPPQCRFLSEQFPRRVVIMSAVAEILQSPEEMQSSSLLKHAPVGFALCQRPGNVTSRNPAFDDLLGMPSSQIPCALPELIRDGGGSRQLVSELFQGNRESFQIECAGWGTENKSLRWTVWAIHAEDSRPDSAVVMLEDLSGVALARQRLQQAERLETVGRLAGGVAHDFNNVLTGVLLYCDLLISVLGPSDRARRYAEEIRNAGLQATGLVRQLLTVVRSNKSLPRPISLNEIAEGMRNLLVRLIGENIELTLKLDSGLGLVNMDPVQAQQVLLNLVLNARDALPCGGHISVETGNCKMQILSSTGENNSETTCLPCVLFAVEDNGLGMDELVRAHLFEPFFTTKAGKGTGIGLATVHDIVSSNGGLIHVQSEVNRGTRINILLPIVPEPAPQFLEDPGFHPTHNGELLSFHSEETTS
ncbi:MAG TPA: ATP-binding protein, partial [Candidatus Sulfotelmatobacter sp.]|nr:ATP-binding protein [Candidatus Sulfotelmatobacter sp.]